MPARARSTLAALKTESFAIEPAVSLKRIVPLPGLRRRKRDRFDLDDASRVVQHAEAEALPISRVARPFTGVCGTSRLGLHDGAHVVLADRRTLDRLSLRLSRVEAVERLPVRVGDDLHGLAAFDRVRGDQLRDARATACAPSRADRTAARS